MNVVVIGAGIVGLTSALALQRAGHQVTVVDAQGGAAEGCSHANGGFLSPSHCSPWAVPGLPVTAIKSLLDRGAAMRWLPDFTWRQVRWLGAMARECTETRFALNRRRMQAIARYSCRCLNELDEALHPSYGRHKRGVLRLCWSHARKQAMQRECEALRADGWDAEWCTSDVVRALEPALCGSAVDMLGGLLVRGEGAGRCEQFSTQLVAHLRAAGVRFSWCAPVDAMVVGTDPAGGRKLHGVRIAGQTLTADACVVAAGVETSRLLTPHLAVPIYPVKGYSLTVPVLDARRAPRTAVLDERTKLAIVAFGDVIRVAGFADVVGYDTSLDHRRCRALLQGLEALYPGVADTERPNFWAGLRPTTPDGTPIIGATDIEGLYLNAGHGTYGWTLSFGSAQLLADVVSGATVALPAEDYALARYQ